MADILYTSKQQPHEIICKMLFQLICYQIITKQKRTSEITFISIYNNWQNSAFIITLNLLFLFLYSIIYINIYKKVLWTDQYLCLLYMCVYACLYICMLCVCCVYTICMCILYVYIYICISVSVYVSI